MRHGGRKERHDCVRSAVVVDFVIIVSSVINIVIIVLLLLLKLLLLLTLVEGILIYQFSVNIISYEPP